MHNDDKQDLVMYLGRKIPKEGFRAYIYSKDGAEKIAESYDEYELCVSTESWFSTKEEAQEQREKKPRKKLEG